MRVLVIEDDAETAAYIAKGSARLKASNAANSGVRAERAHRAVSGRATPNKCAHPDAE